MGSKRVLIIPDLYLGGSSGATVTQVFVKLFKKLGFEVGVISSEFKQEKVLDGVVCFPCLFFQGIANIKRRPYLIEFSKVLDKFAPTHLFFDGSIVNKPLCYLEEGLRRNLHIDVFIFMQDFFCAKLYANDDLKPCTNCLDSLLNAFFCPLISKDKEYAKLLIKQCERRYLKKLLARVNHVITSTDEQIDFFIRFGVSREKCYKMPLPFIMNKKIGDDICRGKYLVGIAQNRVEKGFQFIPKIMSYTHNTKLTLAYYDDGEANKAKKVSGICDLMVQGKLEIVAANWKTGLSELISKSGGVVIPSIWPTTTEYGLLETLAFMKPIVAFNVGIHKEKMQEAKHGYFANVGDLKSFAQKMDLLSTCTSEIFDNLSGNVQVLYHCMTDMGILEQHLKQIVS